MKYIIRNVIALFILWVMYSIITMDLQPTYEIEVYKPKMTYSHCIVADIPNSFYDELGHLESRNRYTKVNSIGYLGKYQFGIETLHWIGFNTTKSEFLNSPEMQEQAVRRYVQVNQELLHSYINKYAGTIFTTYNGTRIYITETGMLAAAHLGGHGSVKKFFNSQGKKNNKDIYGTSIETYLRAFQNTNLI